MQIIRKRAVVYVGLDALSDAEVAAAVGNSMFSDLVSVAGHIYKFGIDDGLPGAAAGAKIPINVHADEFNELMGDEFIPMRSEEHTSELQSLMRISYAVFSLKKKKNNEHTEKTDKH